MFIADPHIVIDKAFQAAGYQYELVSKTVDEAEEAIWRQKIMDSITRGVPVLAFGVIGPPQCCLITGYRNHGEALIGWNYFQDDSAWNQGVEIVEGGYFLKENWFDDTWNLVLIGQKVADYNTVPVRQILSWVLAVSQQTEVMGRHAGQKAFEAWQSFRNRDARRETAAIIGQAQVLDKQAMEHIQQALQQQEKHLLDGS